MYLLVGLLMLGQVGVGEVVVDGGGVGDAQLVDAQGGHGRGGQATVGGWVRKCGCGWGGGRRLGRTGTCPWLCRPARPVAPSGAPPRPPHSCIASSLYTHDTHRTYRVCVAMVCRAKRRPLRPSEESSMMNVRLGVEEGLPNQGGGGGGDWMRRGGKRGALGLGQRRRREGPLLGSHAFGAPQDTWCSLATGFFNKAALQRGGTKVCPRGTPWLGRPQATHHTHTAVKGQGGGTARRPQQTRVLPPK